MCDVCCASSALEPGGAIFQWHKDGPFVRMEARGKGPEGEPCEYRIRRKGSTWSRWAKTNDLAGVTCRLGLDVKWQFTGKLVRGYLSGDLTAEQVIRQIAESQDKMAREIAADTVIYTQFMPDGVAYLTNNRFRTPPEWPMEYGRAHVLPSKTAAVDKLVRKLTGLPEEGL